MSNTSQINASANQCERNTEVIEHQVHQISSNHQANNIGTILEVPTIFRPVTTTVTRRSDATPPSKEQDPFLYFSNQDRRMTYLLRNGKEQVEGYSSNLNDSTVEMVVEERRQRITFEVHPDLMCMEDLLLEGDDLDETDVFDLLFDDTR